MEEQQALLQDLGLGLQAQRRAVRVYEILAAAAPNRRERELLLGVRREERRHYYFLEAIYEDLSGQGPVPPRVALSLPRQYPEMLKTALCDKLAAIDFYQALREKIRCGKNQQLMDFLLAEQKEQARLLAALYDRSMGRRDQSQDRSEQTERPL